MAKRMKYSVIGLPHYVIWHLYEPSLDDLRHMEEMKQEQEALEREEKERQLAAQKESQVISQSVKGDAAKGSEEGPAAQPRKDAGKGSSNK
jgi:mannan polymerase II complex ANP1 subunit